MLLNIFSHTVNRCLFLYNAEICKIVDPNVTLICWWRIEVQARSRCLQKKHMWVIYRHTAVSYGNTGSNIVNIFGVKTWKKLTTRFIPDLKLPTIPPINVVPEREYRSIILLFFHLFEPAFCFTQGHFQRCTVVTYIFVYFVQLDILFLSILLMHC